MPVPLIVQTLNGELSRIPYAVATLTLLSKILPWILTVYAVKSFFAGRTNTSGRNMHSKVVILTGGTSGIGKAIARDLAEKGAQLLLLTHEPLSDPFLADYIMDLRVQSGNSLITAEQVDLSSLHSIRKFATRWVDNAPPRRLDAIMFCANARIPKGAELLPSEDGVENTYQVNFLSTFHLLSILSPAIRAQPPDRDVRIIFGACSSYQSAPPLDDTTLTVPRIGASNIPAPPPTSATPKSASKKQSHSSIFKPSTAIPEQRTRKYISTDPHTSSALSNLLTLTFAHAFQSHLSAFTRPDKAPNNVRVLLADPSTSRTPGFRRSLTRGSPLLLLAYVLTYPLWWLFVKSAEAGAQTFLYAAMDEQFSRGDGARYIKNCQVVKGGVSREECRDETCQKRVWEGAERAIESLEKEGARRRAEEKKKAEEDAKSAERKAASTAEKKKGSRRDRQGK